MKRSLSFLAVGSLFVSPAFAGPNPAKMQQISEVVFQNYPPRALANGEQGAVYFVVALDKAAHATSCQVTHGSGHPLLDEETCNLIVQHAVFNSVLDANGRATKSTHEGVVVWRIPGAPEPSVAPVALTANTGPEKQICKKTLRAGTLAGIERTCMTAREWARLTDESRATWDEFQGRKGIGACNTAGVVAANHPGEPVTGVIATC